VDPLPVGSEYTGPWLNQVNPCQCSTVVYSLVAACGLCQNRTADTWSSWQLNCTQVSKSQFPEDIPSGTAIPAWAYLDVTVNDIFNLAAAQLDDAAPASSATASKPTAALSSTTPLLTFSDFSTPLATPTTTSGANGGGSGTSGTPKKSSNAGAIAGGVVGGIVGLASIAGIVGLFVVRSRRNKAAPSAAYNVYNDTPHSAAPLNTPPPMTQHPYTNPAPRLYDPADPSTYPQAPGTPTIHTTNSGGVHQPYGQQPQATHYYSGVPEL